MVSVRWPLLLFVACDDFCLISLASVLTGVLVFCAEGLLSIDKLPFLVMMFILWL